MKICKFQVVIVIGYYLYSEIWEGNQLVWDTKEPCDSLEHVFSRMREVIEMANS